MIAKIDSCTTKFLQFARLRVGKAATIVKQVKEGGKSLKENLILRRRIYSTVMVFRRRKRQKRTNTIGIFGNGILRVKNNKPVAGIIKHSMSLWMKNVKRCPF